MSRCDYQDDCDCQECIEENAPLCQLCFLNRCKIRDFPEYEKYCNICIPSNALAFIIGTQNKKKVLTTVEKFKEAFPNSFFTSLIDDEFIKRDDKRVFEVPL
ncbi:25677_t:CDS:1, partial [Dentiscutata erythropus]